MKRYEKPYVRYFFEDKKIKGLRIIIAGCRGFQDYNLLSREVLRIVTDKVNAMGQGKLPRELITIISGNAKGADRLGEVFAKTMKLPLEVYPAEWDKYEKAAGPIRNQRMAEEACKNRENYDPMLIAFWDGKSKGTKNMIQIAEEMKMDVHVVKY